MAASALGWTLLQVKPGVWRAHSITRYSTDKKVEQHIVDRKDTSPLYAKAFRLLAASKLKG